MPFTLEQLKGKVDNKDKIIHPWLYDIKMLLPILKREIKLPHEPFAWDGTDCKVCREASDLQQRYFANQLQSKAM